MPLSHVSYWHGALWRRWEGRSADDQSLSGTTSRGTEYKFTGDSQQQQQQQQQQQPELLQHERERLQEEALRETRSIHDPESYNSVPLPGDGIFAVTSEADARTVLRRRIRLER